VLVQSPTGSGKTLAFGVPLVDLVQAEDARAAALVLVPTRELASQVTADLREIAEARALSLAAVYGGAGIERQAKLARRAHILVATPGRLEDLVQRGAIRLDSIRVLVLDEADRMLDASSYPIVLKADGLAAGKGVVIAADRDEARGTVDAWMRRRALGDAGAAVTPGSGVAAAEEYWRGGASAPPPAAVGAGAKADAGRKA